MCIVAQSLTRGCVTLFKQPRSVDPRLCAIGCWVCRRESVWRNGECVGFRLELGFCGDSAEILGAQ